MNLFTKQTQTHRHREQAHCYEKRKGWGTDKLGVWDQQIQTTIYTVDKQQGLNGQHRELYSISCNKL